MCMCSAVVDAQMIAKLARGIISCVPGDVMFSRVLAPLPLSRLRRLIFGRTSRHFDSLVWVAARQNERLGARLGKSLLCVSCPGGAQDEKK